MPNTSITPLHWNMILAGIHDGSCVPILGAGVNVSSPTKGYEGLPLGKEVALRLIQELIGSEVTSEEDLVTVQILDEKLMQEGVGEDLVQLRVVNLPRVALHVIVQALNDRPYLINLLREILADQDRQPSKLLQVLVEMPLRLIVTTNYDCLLERAAGAVERSIEPIVQPIDGFTGEQQRKHDLNPPAEDVLVVYKIHGTFRDGEEKPSSIIITEEDYVQFLTVVGQRGKGVPRYVKARMVDGSLLFLGYSLEDWDFRTLYQGLIQQLPPRKKRTSFAIQWRPPEFWVTYWEQKGVVIYDYDVHEFAEELEEKYVDRFGSLGAKKE